MKVWNQNEHDISLLFQLPNPLKPSAISSSSESSGLLVLVIPERAAPSTASRSPFSFIFLVLFPIPNSRFWTYFGTSYRDMQK